MSREKIKHIKGGYNSPPKMKPTKDDNRGYNQAPAERPQKPNISPPPPPKKK